MNRNKQNLSSRVNRLSGSPSDTAQALLPRHLIGWLVCVALMWGITMNAQADAGAMDPAVGTSLFNQRCPKGEFVQGIDSSGKLLCAAVGLPTPPPSANNCTVTLEMFRF